MAQSKSHAELIVRHAQQNLAIAKEALKPFKEEEPISFGEKKTPAQEEAFKLYRAANTHHFWQWYLDYYVEE